MFFFDDKYKIILEQEVIPGEKIGFIARVKKRLNGKQKPSKYFAGFFV
jgi:hypothetical protein